MEQIQNGVKWKRVVKRPKSRLSRIPHVSEKRTIKWCMGSFANTESIGTRRVYSGSGRLIHLKFPVRKKVGNFLRATNSYLKLRQAPALGTYFRSISIFKRTFIFPIPLTISSTRSREAKLGLRAYQDPRKMVSLAFLMQGHLLEADRSGGL